MLRSRAQVYNTPEREANIADGDSDQLLPSTTDKNDKKKFKYSRLPTSESDIDERQFYCRGKSRVPWRAITLATVLLVFGTVLIVVGIMLLTGYINEKYADRTWPVLILGLLMFIPGSYHVFIAFHAYMGDPGYSYDDIPDFD